MPESDQHADNHQWSISEQARALREWCLDVERAVRSQVVKHPHYEHPEDYPGQHSEMQAQAMLAVRHLEDARMRLGKVCQYAEDGVSKFDK